MSDRPIVLAIVGPTGSGKTDLACAVARRTGAEIVNADSMQVYRRMDIGTAKPSAELRAEIAHHAIDIADPDEVMSAGRYAEHAREAALGIARRARPVVLCGGSGLYARAFAGGLIEGMEGDPELRSELERSPTRELYARLERSDPETVRQISPRDRVRIVRALEVQHLGLRPVSELRREHGFSDRPFQMRWLALHLEREALWRRIEARVRTMFAAGLVDEVRELHAAGYGPELHALRAIGYREVGDLLAGRCTQAQAQQAMVVATRRYAKRQRTWFRREAGLQWVDASEFERALAAAVELLCEPVEHA